jgi:hypothetical protein
MAVLDEMIAGRTVASLGRLVNKAADLHLVAAKGETDVALVVAWPAKAKWQLLRTTMVEVKAGCMWVIV